MKKITIFTTIFLTVGGFFLFLFIIGVDCGHDNFYEMRQQQGQQALHAAEARQLWTSIISSEKEDWEMEHDGKYVLAGTNVTVNICWPFDKAALSLKNQGGNLITFNKVTVYQRSYDSFMSTSETENFQAAINHLLILFGSMVD